MTEPALAVFAWRLGLGWLLGRRVLLLTTQRRSGELRHSVVPYRFFAGNLYVFDDGAPWASDLAEVARATAQAHPGPLGVRARPLTAAEQRVLGQGRWVALEPTGEPVPAGVEPDLNWLWLVAAAVAAIVWADRRR